MKTVILFTLSLYGVIISPIVKQLIGIRSSCRFSPSCSAYAKDSIEKYGIVKGAKMSFLRLVSCQPFFIPLRNHFTKSLHVYRSFHNNNRFIYSRFGITKK